MKIIVNGNALPLKLSYTEIIVLAGFKPGRVLSVSYRGEAKGDVRREGTVSPGESVAVEDGMRFNVFDTSDA